MSLPDLSQARSLGRKPSAATLERTGLVLLLLYLLAGVIYSTMVAPVARYRDEQDYLNLSNNLLHGPGYSLDGTTLSAFRPPGYAFFLAAIQGFGGGFISFRIAQVLLLGGTILLLSRLCAGSGKSATLLIVTSLVVCYPLYFYINTTLYPQTLAGFLFVVVLTLLARSPRGLALNVATGLVFGLLILVVPTFLLTLGVVAGMAFVLKILRGRDVVAMVLAAALVVGVWTGRNAVCFHRFVPISTNSGANFLIGNNEQANAYEAVANAGLVTYNAKITSPLDEFQSDKFYWDAAKAWIKAHPARAFVLYLEKVLNFFNIVNFYSAETSPEVSVGKQAIVAVSYLFLLGLLAWRLIEFRRFPLSRLEIFFLSVYVLSAFTSAIFFTRIRLRLPYDYLIIAIVSMHLVRRFEIWMGGGELALAAPPDHGQGNRTK